MNIATPQRNKQIYTTFHDRIIDKRFQSHFSIRRYAHLAQYKIFLELIPAGSTVLDAGCGEGILTVLLAKHGCKVTGFDLSEPNIIAAKQYAEQEGVADNVNFLLGDIEHIPVQDGSFDYVVSSHVLEHVPDFVKGAKELSRIAKQRVIIAIPTCLNLSSMALLGGDKFWTISRKTLYGIFYGLLRVLWAWLIRSEGVNEGYAGNMELIHIFRFPWKGKESIEAGNLRVLRYRASAYPFPYLSFLLPLSYCLEKFAWMPIFRNLGYGTTYVCEPKRS